MYSSVGGGFGNLVQTNAYYSIIGGGYYNSVGNGAYYSAIGGGYNNTNAAGRMYGTVAGGLQNSVWAAYGTVPGGRYNSAATDAFAAGRRAKANHTGSFVWADSSDADFASTANNQFLIRAGGGVGINKTNPATLLDVNGTVTASNFVGTLAASQVSGTISSNNIGGGSITTVMLATGAVGSNQLADGAVTAAKIGGLLNASQIPNLDANKLTSGTLADARLSNNVARLSADQTFAGINRFTNYNNTSAETASASRRSMPAVCTWAPCPMPGWAPTSPALTAVPPLPEPSKPPASRWPPMPPRGDC